jgi:hypothetical protein
MKYSISDHNLHLANSQFYQASTLIILLQDLCLCIISGFCPNINEIHTHLGFCTVQNGSS